MPERRGRPDRAIARFLYGNLGELDPLRDDFDDAREPGPPASMINGRSSRESLRDASAAAPTHHTDSPYRLTIPAH